MQNAAETIKPGSIPAAEFFNQDPEFQDLMLNIINIHVVSELFGADCFEKSILRAPTPELKMRMARTVMEEYGHHLRFRRLMEELDLDWEEYAKQKGHLTTFDTPIDSWADQVVFLALVDRAAAHQFRHFVNSPYQPFQKACQETLKEEFGHVGLGMDGVKQLLQTPEGREEVTRAIKKWLPVGLQSFGMNASKRNEAYRRWGIKQDTNENMRAAYFEQVRNIITQDWGIELPEDLESLWVSDGEDTERAY
ncbi:MAG: phenylacetate-CoA oxygenase subunit PaaI [Pusillimonas sp.]|nr:phenylacetate-CoA oxygenase subunit PaaI [Pusillimonas sp.]